MRGKEIVAIEPSAVPKELLMSTKFGEDRDRTLVAPPNFVPTDPT